LPAAAQQRYDNYCRVFLQLTNLNSTGFPSIQVAKAGLQLQGDPQPNTHHYQLINACSFSSVQDMCEPGGGGGPGCEQFDVQLTLDGGALGTEVLGTPTRHSPDGHTCPALLIDPGATVDLVLNVGSARALTYSAILELQLATKSVPRTVLLAQTPSTLAFADAQQFICYRLQNTSFSLEAQGASAAMGWRLSPDVDVATGCV
jgi:hypothetical protein